MKVGKAIEDILNKYRNDELVLAQARDCICVIINDCVDDAVQKGGEQ